MTEVSPTSSSPLLNYAAPTKESASLLNRTVRSSAWSTTEYAVGMVLRLGSNLLLTRLLVPEMFGLMALVNIFVQGLQMFSDVGIGPSIIQNERGDDPKFYNTAWTIQVFRGFALWICSCLIAIPIARFYNQPQLVWLVPVAGLSAVISGFNSTSLFRLNRHLQLKKLTMLSIATQAIAIVGMLAWAMVQKSVWALLVPVLVSKIFQMVGSHLLIRGERNHFEWDRDSKAALFRFGRWIFLSTLMTFSANQADRLIFGKRIPIETLGVYSIALMLATMPTQVIAKLGTSVVFPAYSRVRRDSEHFRKVFSRVRFSLLVMGACAVTALIVTGPELIHLLYDPRWSAAGWILPLLAVAAWFQMLECTNGSALLAHGRAHWLAAGTAAELTGMLIMIPLGFHFYGFPGAILGVAVADTFRYTVSVIGIRRIGLKVLGPDMLLSLAIAAAVALTLTFAHWLRTFTTQPAIIFAASILLVALIWLPAALWQWRNARGARPTVEFIPSTQTSAGI